MLTKPNYWNVRSHPNLPENIILDLFSDKVAIAYTFRKTTVPHLIEKLKDAIK